MRRLAGIIVLLLTASLLGAPVPAQAVPSNTPSSSTPNTTATSPTPPLKITGTVRDTAGQPIAGACVDVLGGITTYYAHECTDVTGHYEINNVYFGVLLRIEASAVGYTARWWPSAAEFFSSTQFIVTTTNSPLVKDFVLPTSAEATGAISGTVRRQDASPAAGAAVRAIRDGGGPTEVTYTRTDGTYALTSLVAGQYAVSVSGTGYATQFVPGQTTLDTAQRQIVSAQATTTVNETFLPVDPIPPDAVGTITGTVRDSAGAPIAGAAVDLLPVGLDPQPYAQAVTDPQGQYTLTRLPSSPTTFYLRTNAPGYATTWGGKSIVPAAYQLGAGPVTIDPVLRPGVGAITGTLSDFDGKIPPRTILNFTSVDGSVAFSTLAWFNGHFEMPNVPAGQYRLTLEPSSRPYQYWPGGRTVQDGGTFTVTDHALTVLREALLSPTRIEATVVDDVTGQPIIGACVLAGSGGWTSCAPSIGSGVYVYDSFTKPLEFNSVSVSDEPYYFTTTSGPVVAAIGQTTKVTIRMKPGAQLAFDYTIPADAQAPTQICFSSMTSVPFRYNDGDRGSSCPTVSGGHALLGPIPAGSNIKVFLQAPTGRSNLGAQWVTGSGGGGDQREATDFTFVAGQTTNGPSQHLLYSGSIHGTVTGGGTTTSVCPGPVYPGYLDCSVGTYTLPKLGPYRWPVSLSLAPFGEVAGWSGVGTNRFNAGYVQVTSGGSAQADIRLRSLSQIGVTVQGVPANTWTLTAFDPVTGDRVSDIGVSRALFEGIWVPGQVVLKLSAPAMAQPCYVTVPQAPLPGRRSQPSYVIDPVAHLTITPGANCRPDVTPALQPGSATRR